MSKTSKPQKNTGKPQSTLNKFSIVYVPFSVLFPKRCVSQRHDTGGRHVGGEYRDILALASTCWVVFSTATHCMAQCHNTENKQTSRRVLKDCNVVLPYDNLLHYDIVIRALPEK